MSPDDLQAAQEELYRKYVEEPEEQESMLAEMSERIAHDICKGSGTANFEFDGRDFQARVSNSRSFGNGKKSLMIVIADRMKYKLLGTKYKPYILSIEVDNNLGPEENLRAVVEAFLRHISGTYSVEEL